MDFKDYYNVNYDKRHREAWGKGPGSGVPKTTPTLKTH